MVRVSADCNQSAGGVEIHDEISDLLRKLDSGWREKTPVLPRFDTLLRPPL